MSKSINTSEVVKTFVSFGIDSINEELTARKMAAVTDTEAGSLLLAMGIRSLDEFAATVVNLSKGGISTLDMTAAMVRAFPGHKIGERHGPHYISLARTGSLSPKCMVEVRYAPGKGVRKPNAPSTPTFDLSTVDKAQLERMVKAAKGTPLETMLAAVLATRA